MVKLRVRPWALATAIAVVGVGVAGLAYGAKDYLGQIPPKVASTPPIVTQTCAACHGAQGVSIAPTFPNLAGQNYGYLLKSLESFRSGDWKATTMSGIIQTVPVASHNANLKQLAAYFSQQPLAGPNPAAPKPTAAAVKAGYKLYFEGDPQAKVPSCAACHLSSGLGDAPMAVPRLAGQNAAYLVTELQAFAKGARPSPDKVMTKIASRLTAADMQNVAAYVQVMQPDLLPGRGPMRFDAFQESVHGEPAPGVPASAVSTAARP